MGSHSLLTTQQFGAELLNIPNKIFIFRFLHVSLTGQEICMLQQDCSSSDDYSLVRVRTAITWVMLEVSINTFQGP
jgi:hypothetical protein